MVNINIPLFPAFEMLSLLAVFSFSLWSKNEPKKKNRLRWRKGSSHKYLLKLLLAPLLFVSPFWDGHFSCGKTACQKITVVFNIFLELPFSVTGR